MMTPEYRSVHSGDYTSGGGSHHFSSGEEHLLPSAADDVYRGKSMCCGF